MRCFYHGDVDGVAICKSCGRAICHECCADVGTYAACRNRCEPDVQSLGDLIARNKTAYGKTSAQTMRSGLFTLLMGALFMGLSWYLQRGDGPNYILLSLGALFALYGISQIFAARRWREK
jgi:predicted phage tail protein